MAAFILTDIGYLGYLLSSPIWILIFIFNIWMIIDAVRHQEWIWAVIMFLFPGLSTIFYYFLAYRGRPTATRGFELPGAHDRKRIKQLEAQIHHLDKAHHHSQLGDIYFQQGKLQKAEACYRAATERDPQDLDTRAHLGQCLLRLNRPIEARPLLEGVVAENPKHDYGYSQMALAETLDATGDRDAAFQLWKQITENHSYARAKVQLAELHTSRNEIAEARAQLQDVLNDDVHAPAYQRKRDRIWIRRARSLLGKIG
jgi:hypothetical protein